jgi:hypothetical protein
MLKIIKGGLFGRGNKTRGFGSHFKSFSFNIHYFYDVVCLAFRWSSPFRGDELSSLNLFKRGLNAKRSLEQYPIMAIHGYYGFDSLSIYSIEKHIDLTLGGSL